MIKIIMPNALMRACADVIREHPTEYTAQTMSDRELQSLLRQIEACSREDLPVLALSLVKRELYALCEYIPHNSHRIHLENVLSVLSMRMDPVCYGVLFQQWQNFPFSHAVLQLLAEQDTQENHGLNVRIPPGKFPEWARAENMLKQVNYYVNTGRCISRFSECFANAGFSAGSPLERACYASYLSSCSMQEFVKEGEKQVADCVRTSTTEEAEAVLLNLLAAGDNSREALADFTECFEKMVRMWGIPSKNQFPSDHPAEFRTYTWWFNYTEMSKGFFRDTNRRRRDFWKEYLDRCTVVRYRQHQMLVFDFDTYSVVEFETEGRMYIYESAYFKENVLPLIARRSTTDLKSWMWNYSRPVYERAHRGAWEPEAARQLRHII